MSKKIRFPTITENEASLPVVKALMVIIEQMAEVNQKLEEKVQHLSDEILILKGEKKRPKFKSSKMDENTENSDDDSDSKEGKGKKKDAAPAPVNAIKHQR